MKAKRFILRNRSIKENALWEIRSLPDDYDKKLWEVVLKQYVKPRTDRQHGYYRALLDICSEHTGYELTELHDMFRTRAGLWKTVFGVEVLMSTKEMSVVQMAELIEVTLRTAAIEMELTLPPPREVFGE